MPVRKSDECNGIRMEVVSAYIHGDTAEIYVTMQDLTENRLDDTTDLYDGYSINTPFDCSATCRRVGYDEDTRTVTFLITIEQWEEQKMEGEKITFSVRNFLSHKEEYEELPILIELTEAEEEPDIMETGITGGSGSKIRTSNLGKSTAYVLVPGKADERFPLDEIQFAVEKLFSNDNHGYFFLRDQKGNDIPKEELSSYSLYGHFVISGGFEEGLWTVTFPLE